MAFDEGIMTIMHERYTELLRAPDAGLASGVKDFLEWLFRDERMQPLALDLFRRESLEWNRFLNHQTACYRQAAKLFDRLLAAYPHKIVQRTHVCKIPMCRVHMEELEELLSDPKITDAESLATGGCFVDATPLGRALSCLRACIQEHVHADDSAETLRDEVMVLWMKHQTVCRRVFNEGRCSPVQALRTLMTHDDGTPPTLRSMQDVRVNVARICCELQMAAVSSALVTSVLERYRERCERFDAKRIRQLGLQAIEQGEAEAVPELTLEAQRYLYDHNVAAWSSAEGPKLPAAVREPSTTPVVVQAAAYGGEPRETVLRAILRFHGFLRGLSRADAYLLLFHLDGQPCIAPRRLELGNFGMTIMPIDVAATVERPGGLDPVVLSRSDIWDELVSRAFERNSADRGGVSEDGGILC